jgi:hypothetical protein
MAWYQAARRCRRRPPESFCCVATRLGDLRDQALVRLLVERDGVAELLADLVLGPLLQRPGGKGGGRGGRVAMRAGCRVDASPVVLLCNPRRCCGGSRAGTVPTAAGAKRQPWRRVQRRTRAAAAAAGEGRRERTTSGRTFLLARPPDMAALALASLDLISTFAILQNGGSRGAGSGGVGRRGEPKVGETRRTTQARASRRGGRRLQPRRPARRQMGKPTTAAPRWRACPAAARPAPAGGGGGSVPRPGKHARRSCRPAAEPSPGLAPRRCRKPRRYANLVTPASEMTNKSGAEGAISGAGARGAAVAESYRTPKTGSRQLDNACAPEQSHPL